jgi:hypothetical protein
MRRRGPQKRLELLHLQALELRAVQSLAALQAREIGERRALQQAFLERIDDTTRKNGMRHRSAQAQGRGGIFSDYRLRVACVIRDYGMFEREHAPADSRRTHGA